MTIERMDHRPTTPDLAAPPPPRGAVLLGGAHGAIALARVLAAQRLAVWLVTDDTPLPRFSRAFTGSLAWPGARAPDAVAWLEQAAQEHDLAGYLLIPAADGDVRFVAEAHARLSRTFSVLLPDWSSLRYAVDKGLAYQRARELGLSVPRIYPIASRAEAEAADLQFPVVLKPTMRLNRNRFTQDKAWRADDQATFLARYADAASLVGADNLVVQELVPGGGECQFSYAGLWDHGRPVLGFTARRSRQYPIEFSYTSTFVETVDAPDIRAAAETFLAAIGHHGLVEIEYKRDPRSGALKLLDINPRPWSWFALARAAGVDFGAGIAAMAQGRPVPPMTARPGIAWLFAVRDVVVALKLARSGTLAPGAWLASLWRTRAFASFSWRDPLPGLVELPLTLFRVLARARKRQ
jgi:predicted ATP-grasp superfamily ATP-dependent carboligase